MSDLDQQLAEALDAAALPPELVWESAPTCPSGHDNTFKPFQQVQRLLDERRQLLDWQPHRVAVREIHDAFTHKAEQNLIPVCPHCHQGIEYAELTRAWVDRAYAAAERARREGKEAPHAD